MIFAATLWKMYLNNVAGHQHLFLFLKPFHAASIFLYPLKTSESQKFADVSRGRVYFRKKGQGQIHWKGHYIFNLRAPYFRTAVGIAQHSWRVWGDYSTLSSCSGLGAELPGNVWNFNHSKCTETAFTTLWWRLKFE